MIIARWIHIGLLAIIFMVGTIHCAGPQSQVIKGTAEEEALKESAELTKEAPPEGPAAAKPQGVPPKEEIPAQKREGIPEPPRPGFQPRMPSTIPSPTPPATVSPAPVTKPSEAVKNSRFVLNFDNADIYEVIRVMAEMMSINYIVDPRVRGVVNIRTTGQISTKDIFPIFQAILKMNGATAVPKGLIYEIVPMGEAKKLYVSPTVGRDPGKNISEEKYTIQIIVLKYIPAPEVSRMIKPFLSDGADIVEHPHHNLLILGDIYSNIQKALDLIELFDVDIFADMRVRIYPILNSDVNEVAKEMERIFSSLEVSVRSGRGVGITFTPIIRINSLLVVSSIPGIFDKVERWLRDLDRIPGEGTQIRVFVYYVQNGKAKDMAEVLKQVYVPPKAMRPAAPGVTPTAVPTSQQRLTRPPGTPETPAAPAAAGAREEAGGVPLGEINIVVDETTNSLIIRAYQRDYRAIMETIKKLDIYPKQVLIEVLLAEVTLSDSTKFGLEFSTFTDSFTKGAYNYSYTVGMGGIAPPAAFSSGLRYAISSVDRLAASIQASASQDRLRVISSPHILASNNKEARIQVGSAQPVLSNTYTTTATGTPGVVEGTIEYKDIGIILTVTPRISDAKLVTLELSVESSTVGQTKLGNLDSVPVFGKKMAKTTLSIMEGQTIVIGGLIEDRRDTLKSGVPFLSKIPILGALFGYQSYSVDKTETVIFMTPHVIGELEDSNRITQEFREKIYGIQKEMEKIKKEKEKQKEKDSPKAAPSSPQTAIPEKKVTSTMDISR